MTATADRAHARLAFCLDPPVPPGWVTEWMAGATSERQVMLPGGFAASVREHSELSLLRTTVPGAKGLSDREFRLAVERAYLSLGAWLHDRGRTPLRFWNYVPGIRTRTNGGLSRYEAFNLGRYLAYTAWYESSRFGERLAAASAVDHRGEDFVVHVLAGSHPGTPLENPRQIPAWRYSRRYGPLPPCFSRATVVRRPLESVQFRCALVSGTSSIVGEDARHAGDCAAQLRETIVNLALVATTFSGIPLQQDGNGAAFEPARALSRSGSLRACVVREQDAKAVAAALRKASPAETDLEVFTADLCRPELLVEVEGVACSPDRDDRVVARPRA